jgi:signal peptidase I
MTKKTSTHSGQEITWVHIGRSTRETIESIVIAFILAFVFRAFIVEAYRIPTGSMAPTLYGAHRITLCPDCGFEYAYEIQQRSVQGRVVDIFPRVTVCPNCKWVHKPNPNFSGGSPLVDGGDRILVMKMGFELSDIAPSWKAMLGPRRWDVVVFKNPSDPSINFIKRLIGLPGEKIELIDGDVYANNQICRKTPTAAQSLWFHVYNNDYLPTRRGQVDPKDLPGWIPFNQKEEKLPWDTTGRVLIFHPQKDKTGFVTFNGPIQDFYGYDDPDAQHNRMFTVSDLKMEFMLNLHKSSPPGRLELVLSKRNDVFIAKIDTTGKAQLLRTTRSDYQAGKNNPILVTEGTFPPIDPVDPRTVTFENCDYRIRLKIADRVILETTDEQYHPDIPKLLRSNEEEITPLVRIGAADCNAQIWHLNLMRDIYYRHVAIMVQDTAATVEERNFSGLPGWGVAGNPIQLGPHDYFVCGDNSPESMDSRLWYQVGPHLRESYKKGTYQMGTVPADQMVGKAFFVYWPAGYRLFKSGPPIIPNVGEMRFIR